MRPSTRLMTAGLILALGSGVAAAQHVGTAKPDILLQELVTGLPRDEKQFVRVLTATFQPGDKTVTHTHRFPVTVYVLEGTFTLELTGQPPVVLKKGEAFVEPPHVTMTGYNRSASEPTKVVI